MGCWGGLVVDGRLGFTRNIINQMQKYMCVSHARATSGDDVVMCVCVLDHVVRNALNAQHRLYTEIHTLRTDAWWAPSIREHMALGFRRPGWTAQRWRDAPL